MVTRPAGPETTNDCAGERQQQFTRPTDSVRVVTQKNMATDPVGSGNKNDCAGEGQQ
jgi:hypothetical protein